MLCPPRTHVCSASPQVPLSSWGRLDRQSPWQEFAAACTRLGSLVTDFQPQVVWGIDWTSLHPYYEISGRLHPPEELDSGALPYVFMNYRQGLHIIGMHASEAKICAEHEQACACMQTARVSVWHIMLACSSVHVVNGQRFSCCCHTYGSVHAADAHSI